MAVRNLCCATCATVYITPRPSAEAMSEYYRSTYRQHYGAVAYVNSEGRRFSVGEPGYEAALLGWHDLQANNALLLAQTAPGASVLEVGCRHGKTLSLMRERRGITAFGIEPGENEAEEARQAGIDCFTGALEDFDPGERRFDQVQCFHVLEHVNDPLAALIKMGSWLKPNGKLLLEVPNVYRPYGLLEENFFQNVHLVSYSPNTLPALARRAGLQVSRVVDAGSLFVLATPATIPENAALPLPFRPDLLATPDQNADWVAIRLQSYAHLEKVDALFKQNGPLPELIPPLIRGLAFPAFVEHMVNVCASFVEALAAKGRLDEALAITLAVANGPHPSELRQEFGLFATRLGAPPEALQQTG
jgi:2-polyprenyl-3-methyl-5-hydroxy-6-metoxy-1,4-benzoquinol methylase